ncbi:hypothetical protein C8R42DRAFT_724641 [Lentinula raphanica]|nr:hypothetical protein C8R42DRAFT_724641 [Lentinula raphanica]
MQVHFWARNIVSGASIEITPPRPLHLTNVSVSFDFRDAFAPTSLLLSVVLVDGRSSPRYTVATLIAGQTNTVQVDLRLDQGSKYVLTVSGPNALSLLGYHTQSSDNGHSAPLNSHNPTVQVKGRSTNQNSDPGSKIAPGPGMTTAPPDTTSANGFEWGATPMPNGAVPSTMLAGNKPLFSSQLTTPENGRPLQGPNPGAQITSSRVIKPLRHRHANPSLVSSNTPSVVANPSSVSSNPSPANTVSNDNNHGHAFKRVKNGDGTFTNRYPATDGELHGRLGQHEAAITPGTNANKRKSTADSCAQDEAIVSDRNKRHSMGDGGAGYSSHSVPAAMHTYVMSSAANQAGPFQYRLPMANHSTQNSTQEAPANDDTH